MTTITNSNPKRTNIPAFNFGFLLNISMAWKMGLLTITLFLGLLGITLAGYFGLQSLRYQLSNIYDFMLIPIVAINHADTALADVQYEIENLNELPAGELIKSTEFIQTDIKTTSEIITRYDTEWVTTVSPEFTQALRNAGKLDLQEQEVAILARFHSSFEAFLGAYDAYVTTLQAGEEADDLERQTHEYLASARADLQELIDINNQYADFSNQQAQEAYRRALSTGGIVLTIALLLGLTIAYLIAASITSRLGELTQSATAMQQGNLDQTVSVTGRDEVGLLGTAFNAMSQQLKDMISSLEQRVTARTKDLATVAEVGTATATILESNRLLQEVVELTKERFNLYHSHIYLLDEAEKNLVLTAGAGEPGRIMSAEKRSIPLDREQSLVARAARERRGVTVNDVTQAPDFLPNPLLPDTRSELAVPMIVGGHLIGVFDIQSDLIGRFTDSDINIQTTLAAQVATSIQNVRSFEHSREQVRLDLLVNAIGQKIQRSTNVEDALQTAIRELGTAIGASRVKVMIQSAPQTGSSETPSAG